MGFNDPSVVMDLIEDLKKAMAPLPTPTPGRGTPMHMDT